MQSAPIHKISGVMSVKYKHLYYSINSNVHFDIYMRLWGFSLMGKL